ncbi:branched-chain amino acid transport system II carrier protein [Alkaliphilus oremlandii]|uniref:Branched-chain amino acid transport system carrier protein n=1 Tax=Alkaliphilus oremlandii (strain OhILAs) TaxID=350688 RepID=A8MK97_ALKOO|nr:branched-chain amino acid transport system II carrier protein [Alkaliphilus oremlandii]ABW20229.1 branched-chain amino acid transport system II carrier protein [Alkaliphilus oremlandii OhILAs]
MLNKKNKDVLIIGFALFAMFFGAGNLIFPPALGQLTGDKTLLAVIGFLITGVGLPLCGIIAVANCGGNLEVLGSNVSKKFGVFISVVVTLAIGPFLAIPRTSATTFEMSVLPFFSEANNLSFSIVFSIVYFAIVLFFVLRPSSVIDNIGKILTPVLFITLLVIIVKGIVTPIGELGINHIDKPFATGFQEGYQTMDALAATVLGSIVVASIRSKGYRGTKEVSSLTIKSGLVAIFGLAIIYGGLAFLGATATTLPMDIPRTKLIMLITESILGTSGKILLALSVGLACLTTSIGLVAATGEYFSKLTKNKLSYSFICVVTSVISIVISNIGVDQITSLAVPLLVILYPVVIALVSMIFLDKYIPHRAVYAIGVYTTLLVSVLELIAKYMGKNSFLYSIYTLLPLASQGFAWVVPTIVTTVIAGIFIKVFNIKDSTSKVY